MRARFRSRWQKIKQYPVTILVVAIILVVAVALIIVEIRVYGTGFKGKTLWDWLQLLSVLAVPVVVGFGAVWFTVRHNHDIELAHAQHESDQRITLDNQRETVLQTYLDKMSELILHENLHNAERGNKVRSIARARTLTALSKLDPSRKRSIILFLYESDLINCDDEKIDLSWADLREADLSQLVLNAASFEGAYLQGANLSEADLSQSKFQGANLQDANLSGTNLMHAELTGANLRRADLRWANLRQAELLEIIPYDATNLEGADLREANLKEAKITSKQIKQAKSLKGAMMPDGSIHP